MVQSTLANPKLNEEYVMRACFLYAVALIPWIACLATQTTCGQAATLQTPIRGKPVPLFDGKSLAGWEMQDGSPSKNWIIQDGAIFRASQGGDLYHAHWYRDFELSFQWKLNKNGNSGVKYRVQPYGKHFLGCEYQLQDEPDIRLTKNSTGSIYALYAPNDRKQLNPPGQWNRSRIVVCGNQVEHWLNGQKIVEAQFGSPDWRTRVQSSKFNNDSQFGENREGRIFLQDHGNPVWFREIVLIPLDCDVGF